VTDENAKLWHDLRDAWDRQDWTAGVETLRPVVERFPDVLATRFMLAALSIRAGSPAVAVLQYEKLLVLAVGQGSLFHALAAQRRLDELRPPGAHHARRYQAIQQWFRAIPARKSKGDTTGRLMPHMLLTLSPGEFAALGESLRVETLDPEIREFRGPDELLEVLLWGGMRWVLKPAGETPFPAVEAATGDTLCAPPGTQADDRLTVETTAPSEVLGFDPEFASMLREAIQKEAEAKRAKMGPRRLAPARVAPKSDPAAPDADDAAARPQPDPEAEPLRATSFPRQRRHEHRMGIDFATGAVRLGLAGSRTSPFTGRLLEFSPAGIGVELPGAPLRQSRRELEGSVVNVYLRLPDMEDPLRLAARITALAFERSGAPRDGAAPGGRAADSGAGAARTAAGSGAGAGGGAGVALAATRPFATRARLSMEFALLLAGDRALIQEALIRSAAAGQWPGVEGAADDEQPAAA